MSPRDDYNIRNFLGQFIELDVEFMAKLGIAIQMRIRALISIQKPFIMVSIPKAYMVPFNGFHSNMNPRLFNYLLCFSTSLRALCRSLTLLEKLMMFPLDHKFHSF